MSAKDLTTDGVVVDARLIDSKSVIVDHIQTHARVI